MRTNVQVLLCPACWTHLTHSALTHTWDCPRHGRMISCATVHKLIALHAAPTPRAKIGVG